MNQPWSKAIHAPVLPLQESGAAILDVHVPHATHTWKDFFIHIATIIVGLLIAVGLEQSVEGIHHAHQRTELREALLADAVKTIQDTEGVERWRIVDTQWLNGIIDQIDNAVDTGHPLADAPADPTINFEAPDDPAWKSARSSGLLALLPQEDIKAYSEVDGVLTYGEALHVVMNADHAPVRQFCERFKRHGATRPDFSHATAEDLEKYRALLVVFRDGINYYAYWIRQAHGAEISILHGERNLDRIQKAETL